MTLIVKGKNVKLQLWDTAGQEKYKSMVTSYYRGANIALIVFDLTNHESFDALPNWIENFYKNGPEQKNIILIGNKKDLENERQVSFEQGMELREKKNFAFFQEISCATENDEKGENDNIDEIISLFNDIGKRVYKEYINNRSRLNSSSYCYQPTTSILYSQKGKSTKKSGSCCC